jgi:prepilin-type N-terminal cleavage/methylation domain-containing protein
MGSAEQGSSSPTRRASGFTLLEVMVAVAILAISMGVLLQIVTSNVRATNHAKRTTAATFLARGKMIDVEDYVLDKGFTDDNEDDHGTFKEQGYPEMRWEWIIERVELPSDLARKSQDKAQDQVQSAQSTPGGDPMSMMTGFLGGMMSSFIEPVRIGLQESVRRVTVRVLWEETARPTQSIEVVQYLTDPAKLEAAIPSMNAAGAPGAPGTPGGFSLPGMGGTSPTGGTR